MYIYIRFGFFPNQFIIIHNVSSCLFVTSKDQIIFISPDNCSFKKGYILALYLLVTVLSKRV